MSKIRIRIYKEILNGHKIVLEDGILSESVGDSKQRIFLRMASYSLFALHWYYEN